MLAIFFFDRSKRERTNIQPLINVRRSERFNKKSVPFDTTRTTRFRGSRVLLSEKAPQSDEIIIANFNKDLSARELTYLARCRSEKLTVKSVSCKRFFTFLEDDKLKLPFPLKQQLLNGLVKVRGCFYADMSDTTSREFPSDRK